MPVEPATFRDALGRFPTGVTVVTAIAPDGRKIGITVSSFTSLSLDPPLILFCLDRNNPDLDNLLTSGRFVVNILSEFQTALSDGFAMEAGDKWQGVKTEGGCPRLEGTLAALECRLENCFPGGDHVILTGQVEAIHFGSGEAPLAYYRSAYRRLAES